MITTSIFNIKGGVGKTTTTVNLAACLAKEGYKVLVVDTDPQGNASMTFDVYNTDDLYIGDALLDKSIDPYKLIKKTEYENIDVVPSNIKLAFVDSQILLDVTKSQQNRLSNFLSKISSDYDYCIIDCATSLNTININVLTASDEVIIPIKIDKYALDGLENLIDKILEIKEEFNHKLNLKGCLITMDSQTKVNKDIKAELKKLLEDKMFETTIRNTVKVIESTFDQNPVIKYSSKCNASKDYSALCKEVFLNE